MLREVGNVGVCPGSVYDADVVRYVHCLPKRKQGFRALVERFQLLDLHHVFRVYAANVLGLQRFAARIVALLNERALGALLRSWVKAARCLSEPLQVGSAVRREVRGNIIGHARKNMYVNLSHAWLHGYR